MVQGKPEGGIGRERGGKGLQTENSLNTGPEVEVLTCSETEMSLVGLEDRREYLR